jgi:hypothetical protein
MFAWCWLIGANDTEPLGPDELADCYASFLTAAQHGTELPKCLIRAQEELEHAS